MLQPAQRAQMRLRQIRHVDVVPDARAVPRRIIRPKHRQRVPPAKRGVDHQGDSDASQGRGPRQSAHFGSAPPALKYRRHALRNPCRCPAQYNARSIISLLSP